MTAAPDEQPQPSEPASARPRTHAAAQSIPGRRAAAGRLHAYEVLDRVLRWDLREAARLSGCSRRRRRCWSPRLSVVPKRAEVPVLLDVLQDAAELVRRGRDVSALAAVPCFAYGERIDIGTRKPRPPNPELLRGDVIVEAAPVVPDDDDRTRIPVRALADRVDDARDPRRVRRRTRRFAGMVRVVVRRNDPRHGG